MTKEYAVIFESPYYIDMGPKTLILGGKPIQDLFKSERNETTKIHVVKISDGTVQSFDSGLWSFVFHFGNAYMRDENTIVAEASHFTEPATDPFKVFWKKRL